MLLAWSRLVNEFGMIQFAPVNHVCILATVFWRCVIQGRAHSSKWQQKRCISIVPESRQWAKNSHIPHGPLECFLFLLPSKVQIHHFCRENKKKVKKGEISVSNMISVDRRLPSCHCAIAFATLVIWIDIFDFQSPFPMYQDRDHFLRQRKTYETFAHIIMQSESPKV